jgi:hypothetical protein
MIMKIRNVQLVIDPITYEPRYTFEGSIAATQLLDGKLDLEEEFEEIIGSEFLLQLEEGIKEFRRSEFLLQLDEGIKEFRNGMSTKYEGAV